MFDALTHTLALKWANIVHTYSPLQIEFFGTVSALLVVLPVSQVLISAIPISHQPRHTSPSPSTSQTTNTLHSSSSSKSSVSGFPLWPSPPSTSSSLPSPPPT